MSARLTGRRRRAHHVLEQMTRWAEEHDAVHALALVGSYARGQERMASDVDVLVLTDDHRSGCLAPGWFQDLLPGSRLVRAAAWGPVREERYRVRSGLLVEVDAAPPSWADVPLDAGTRRVLGDGCRVLHDPRGALARAVAAAVRPGGQ